MEEWLVNLIVGLVGVILGFFGGVCWKTHLMKINQKTKGNNNIQIVGEIDNGEQIQSKDKRKR